MHSVEAAMKGPSQQHTRVMDLEWIGARLVGMSVATICALKHSAMMAAPVLRGSLRQAYSRDT